MVSYLTRLLGVTVSKTSIPSNWKRALVVCIHIGDDRSLVTDYRPVSLISVFCEQIEHALASYLRQVWDRNYWLYEGEHGLRPGYSCESQVISFCQDIAESLDNGSRLDAIAVDFSKPASENRELGMELRVVECKREFSLGRKQRVRVGGQLSEEVRVLSVAPQGNFLGKRLFLGYINDTRVVRKVSDMIFVPQKLMKHGRCAVVGRWRVPSCAYVDFFTPANTVSPVQPACEWDCTRSARLIIFAKVTERLEQRYCIKFCQKLGDNQEETIRKIQRGFGDDALGNTQKRSVTTDSNMAARRWKATLVSVGPQQVEMTSLLTKCGLLSCRTVMSPSENLRRRWE